MGSLVRSLPLCVTRFFAIVFPPNVLRVLPGFDRVNKGKNIFLRPNRIWGFYLTFTEKKIEKY